MAGLSAGGAVSIRMARAHDAPIIQTMLEALAAAIGEPGGIKGTLADLLHHGFGPDPLFNAFIAAINDVDAGMLLAFPEYSSWRGKRGCYVQDLYVDPAYRGTGIARALLARAAQGSHYLRLSVSASNHSAAQFYIGNGFTKAHNERMFVLEGAGLAALNGSN